MTKSVKVPATDEAWESGQLGREAEFAKRVKVDNEELIDDSLGLQLISIRLPKALIEDFKMIAQFNKLGYQPLMRQVLKRFAEGEKRLILKEWHDHVMRQREMKETEAAARKEKAA